MKYVFPFFIAFLVLSSVSQIDELELYDCFETTVERATIEQSRLDIKRLKRTTIHELRQKAVDDSLRLYLEDIDADRSEEFALRCDNENYTVVVSKYRFATGLGTNIYGWLIYHHATANYCIIESLSNDLRFFSYNFVNDCFEIYSIDYGSTFLQNRSEATLCYDFYVTSWKPGKRKSTELVLENHVCR